MQLTVQFEHWHLGDGSYPAFAVGDRARLSFELDVVAVEPVGDDVLEGVRQIRDAEYEVVGRVIRSYPDGISSAFPVIEAGSLRLHCPTSMVAALPTGARVRLRGLLALDHYQWVEFLERHPDPPDLFYPVEVMRVRQVRMPERFIARSERTVSAPTALRPGDYGAEDVYEADAVVEGPGLGTFSLLGLRVLPPDAEPRCPTFLAHDA